MAVVNQTPIVSPEVHLSKPARRLWLAASGGWIALILFSSTSVAAESSERAFAWIYDLVLGKHLPSHKAFDFLQFLASKCLHLTLFLVLGLLLWQLIVAPRSRRLATVVLAGGIVGTASEILQAFFPGRDPAIRDVLINVVGTLLGAAVRAWRE